VFESFVAAEIVKQQINAGRSKELYYFRDQQGLEVDFVVPCGVGALALIEAKATQSPTPAMTQSIQRLSASIDRYKTKAMLIHSGTDTTHAGNAIAKGVSALTLAGLLDELGAVMGR
jgi:uncharacterized protein